MIGKAAWAAAVLVLGVALPAWTGASDASPAAAGPATPGAWTAVAERTTAGRLRIIESRWSAATRRARHAPASDATVCLRRADAAAAAAADCTTATPRVHLAPRPGERPAEATRPTTALLLHLDAPAVDTRTGQPPRFELTAGALRQPWQPALARGRSGTPLQPVHVSGPVGEASFDMVLVADGFTAAEAEAFAEAAATVAEQLLATPPYSSVASLVNLHGLFVASPQSGADHPASGIYVDTAFDTAFDYAGIARLAVADNGKVLAAAVAALPEVDLAVVISNDATYGGSGGVVPVASMHPDSIEILRHELGHRIADLADEYSAPYPGYPDDDHEPNVARAEHLDPPKWDVWIEGGTPLPTPAQAALGPHAPIGAFEGAKYKDVGMFRPTPDCIMRKLGVTFCPICAEAMVLAVAQQTETVRLRLPAEYQVACTLPACPVFSVQTAALDDLHVEWWRGATLVGSGPAWQPGPGDAGTYPLNAVVRDQTALVRADPLGLLAETVSWQVAVAPAWAPSAPDATDAPDPAEAADATEAAEAAEGTGEDDGDDHAQPPPPALRTATCQAGRGAPTGSGGAWAAVLAALLVAGRRLRASRRHGAPRA